MTGSASDGGSDTTTPQWRERAAARRRTRWSRPRPPLDWRYFVGSLGKVLIAVGVLMFGFVAYQLWGTGLEYAQAQNRLDEEFDELIAAATTVAPTTAPETTTTTDAPVATAAAQPTDAATTAAATTAAATTVAPTTVAPTVPVPVLDIGDALARIEIPTIDLDAVVVVGVDPDDLKEGPGHYPGTPMPGQLGNSAIAGHRTTYGQPFYSLNEIRKGEEIVLTTVQGRFVYRMTGREIVTPEQGQVVATTDPTVAKLTLTTCDPRFTATNRLIVYADLDTAASGQPLPPVLDYSGGALAATGVTLPGEQAAPASDPAPAPASDPAPAPTSAPVTVTVPTTETPGTDPPATPVPAAAPPVGGPAPGPAQPESVDAFAQGWFSDDAAYPQVALWGAVLSMLGLGAYLVSRTLRRNWAGALIGIAPFAVALYFFFQNVNRLLPAAL